jgi:hypothetical protein
MTSALLLSLESLVFAKRQRLAITRSPRSREVLKREIQLLRKQIDALQAMQET